MDMLRADRLNRIIDAEDKARQLRNLLNKRSSGLTPMTPHEGALLADAVAQALQAIRESL